MEIGESEISLGLKGAGGGRRGGRGSMASWRFHMEVDQYGWKKDVEVIWISASCCIAWALNACPKAE